MAEVLQVTHPGGNLFYRAPISQNVPPLPILFFQDRFWVGGTSPAALLPFFKGYCVTFASLCVIPRGGSGCGRMQRGRGTLKAFHPRPSKARPLTASRTRLRLRAVAPRPSIPPGAAALGEVRQGDCPTFVPRGLLPIMGSACKPMWQSTEDDAIPFKGSAESPDA